MTAPISPRSLMLPAHLGGVVVVDVEGNGRQPPEIVEIALLDLRPGVPVTIADTRTWLVRPAQPITGFVTGKVHGIRNTDVAAAPSWRQVAADVAAALDGRVLAAHNAGVERRVLAEHLPGLACPVMLDTLRLARAVCPDLPGGHSLDNLLAKLQLPQPDIADASPPPGSHLQSRAASFDGSSPAPETNPPMARHRAGYDAWITAGLLIELVQRAQLDDRALHRVAAPSGPTTAPPRSRTRTDDDHPEGTLW